MHPKKHRSLEADLEELERTDPEVAAARASYDKAVRQILSRPDAGIRRAAIVGGPVPKLCDGDLSEERIQWIVSHIKTAKHADNIWVTPADVLSLIAEVVRRRASQSNEVRALREALAECGRAGCPAARERAATLPSSTGEGK